MLSVSLTVEGRLAVQDIDDRPLRAGIMFAVFV